VCAWLVFRERRALLEAPRGSSAWGLVALGAAVWLLDAGLLERSVELTGLALVLALLRSTLAFFGRATARRLAFPFVFALFLVPVRPAFLVILTKRMKIVASWLAVTMIHAVGIPAVRDGPDIHLEGAALSVGDACSGLKNAV